MDAIDFWLLRYETLHGFLVDDLVEGLTSEQVRGRPVPGVNPIAWLVWHAMRIEDVCVNRFVADRPQVLDDGWLRRLAIARRDVGTGMTDAQVDELCAAIDLDALRGYCQAVTRASLDLVPALRALDLAAAVPAERVRHVAPRRARSIRARRGSPTSGPAGGAGGGSCSRRRCSTCTATISRG